MTTRMAWPRFRAEVYRFEIVCQIYVQKACGCTLRAVAQAEQKAVHAKSILFVDRVRIVSEQESVARART